MQINEPVITSLEGTRATWAEVNLTRLSQNLKAIRDRVSPAKVMIIVKANAYGHGLAEVAKHLSPDSDYVGVAVLEEGILSPGIGGNRSHYCSGWNLGRPDTEISSICPHPNCLLGGAVGAN